MKTKLLPIACAFLGGCAAMIAVFAITGADVDAQESTAKADENFFMLNALWFKEDGGAAKYMEYMLAAGPFVAQYGGVSEGAYVPEMAMIGKFDADLIFFVEWPNQKAFTDFLADPGYQAVSHLRGEAIRDSFLIRCRKM